jgi:serine/threonine protein kinase
LPIAADAPGGLCPACALVGAAAVPPTSAGGPHSPPPSVAEIAPHFPELEILELLGAGGMGAVYKVRQPQLDRTVALKLLSRQLAQDPAFVERFNREAKVLARLSHPNIVAVFDFGTAGPYCYLLMEYVDGVNLRQAMRTGGFTPAEALTLIQDVCAALQFAHEEGILHRDIKPENILIDAKGRVKIADFGIAKLVGGGAASDVTLTLQGSILGSPHYMAPEQIETPGDVDQRADIYSLGVVLYEMLTGELPIGRFALPSEKAALNARIDEIVLRTLAKERERRYQTVSELKTGFEGIGNPAAPSQAAFINQQLLMIAKYTFRIAMILLAILVFDIALVGGTDSLLDSARYFPYLAGAAVLLSSVSAVVRAIHASRTRGLQPDRNGPRPESAHLPIRQEQRTSHLGLTAAILTGISLVSSGVTLYLANTLRESDLRMVVIATAVCFDGALAVLGFILGAKALGEIRRSGRTEEEVGAPVFAVVLWPLLLLAGFGWNSVPSSSGDGGGSVSVLVAFAIVGGSLALAALVLVRGLCRWARGVTDKNGAKRHPGLVLPILSVIGLKFLGVALLAVFAHIDPLGNRNMTSGPGSEERKAATMVELGEEEGQGRPGIAIPIRLPAGVRANFLLVERNEKGGQTVTTIGQVNARSPETVIVKVGAFGDHGSANGSAPGIDVTLRSAGQYFKATTGTNLSGWEFFQSVTDAPAIAAGERREFELANRPGTGNALAEVMHLVVETTSLD